LKGVAAVVELLGEPFYILATVNLQVITCGVVSAQWVGFAAELIA